MPLAYAAISATGQVPLGRHGGATQLASHTLNRCRFWPGAGLQHRAGAHCCLTSATCRAGGSTSAALGAPHSKPLWTDATQPQTASCHGHREHRHMRQPARPLGALAGCSAGHALSQAAAANGNHHLYALQSPKLASYLQFSHQVRCWGWGGGLQLLSVPRRSAHHTLRHVRCLGVSKAIASQAQEGGRQHTVLVVSSPTVAAEQPAASKAATHSETRCRGASTTKLASTACLSPLAGAPCLAVLHHSHHDVHRPRGKSLLSQASSSITSIVSHDMRLCAW